jgi:hypothetical protein
MRLGEFLAFPAIGSDRFPSLDAVAWISLGIGVGVGAHLPETDTVHWDRRIANDRRGRTGTGGVSAKQ